MTVKRISSLAVFAALSLAIYAAESLLPPLFPLPGMKLGLANIITLFLLKEMSAKEAALVLWVRILLSTLLFGQLLSLLFSAFGGTLSLLAMAAMSRTLRKKYSFLTGAIGGLTHNIGQLIASFVVLRSIPVVLAYLPPLALCGILTGLFTGLAAGFASKYLPKSISDMIRD